MMKNIEERIRDAMRRDESIAPPPLFELVERRRAAGDRVSLPLANVNRSRIWPIIGVAAAVALLMALPLLEHDAPSSNLPVAKASGEGSLFLPSALLAQSTLTPSFEVFSRAARADLRPGRWQLGQIADGRVREHYEYSIARSRFENQPAWLVVSGYYYGNQIRTIDSMWTSLDSLEPRLKVTSSGTTRIERTYRDDDILIGTTQNGYTSWASVSKFPKPWEAGQSVLQVSGVALRFQAATLSRDWKRSLPYPVMTSQQQTVYLNLVVDGEEQIEVPAGRFDAWRIRLQIGDREPRPYDPANPPAGIYYWVSKDRQWMLKMAFIGKGGPETTPIVLLNGQEE